MSESQGDTDFKLKAGLNELRDKLLADLRQLQTIIAETEPAALDWRPFPESNSMMILAAHIVGCADEWVVSFAGGLAVERNRSDEFVATAVHAPALVAKIEAVTAKITQVFAALREDDLSRIVAFPGRAKDHGTVLWSLVHAVEHTSAHFAELRLMLHFYRFLSSSQLADDAGGHHD